MKKLFILASALIAFTGASSVPVAHATIGDFCTSDASCGTNETCNLGTVANPGTNTCMAATQTPLAPPAPTTQPTNYVQQSSINPPSNPPPTTVSGTGFVPLAPIPGLTDSSATSVVNSTTLAVFFNNLYKYLIGIAAVLAVIEIIWGGLEIAINKENVSKITDAKGRIVQALFGLVLVLSPVLVFSVINPSILNLSLDLPALNTAPVVNVTSAPTTPQTANVPNTSTKFITPASSCSSGGCPSYGQQCASVAPTGYGLSGEPDLVCVKSDGITVDLNNFVPNCASGESIKIWCSYTKI
ncbi:MAG: hypothetical protein KGI71_03340 [Patescibacteria group bacterium]|nr:hypothetical protein [Patescibacteria group bacterium]